MCNLWGSWEICLSSLKGAPFKGRDVCHSERNGGNLETLEQVTLTVHQWREVMG